MLIEEVVVGRDMENNEGNGGAGSNKGINTDPALCAVTRSTKADFAQCERDSLSQAGPQRVN